MTESAINIPPMSARAWRLARGGRMRIIDLAGGQPGDLVAFNANDYSEHFSQARTRVENQSCRAGAGDALWTNAVPPRVMLRIVADDSDGMHDLIYTPCCRYALEKRFDVSRDGCHEHLTAALADRGIVGALPDPLNLFFHVAIAADGTLALASHNSKPGAAVVIEAQIDCVVAVATCAVPIAGRENSGYHVEF
jgi:uncharacterized protein YcgI (DUF1989 family)